MSAYDVIVLGTGGMGSAAVHQLARRGRRVLGLERYGPAHALGSSHGGSRVYRQSYFEDPAYVPLLLRAPDEHFVLGRHPAHDNVVVACGFSGHGFRFVPVIGEIVADLALDGATKHPIALFDPLRRWETP